MNSADLKKARMDEYKKIIRDTPYALKKYLKTYDNTVKKEVAFELFDDQIQLIKDLEEHNNNITKKYRQAGVTTVTAGWISKLIQTAKRESPHKVLIIANKLEISIEMANKIRNFLGQWPKWMNVGFSGDKNSEKRFKMNNGCEVKAVATSNDALRGFTPTILIFDEAAFIEAGPDFWAASMAALSTGGKVILISTPNGYDPIYYGVYDQALKGINDFHITDLRWFKDPRYNKDLTWVKVKDIVHYMLHRDEYNDDEISLKDWDLKNYQEYLDQGYKPYSSWLESMAKKFKYDKKSVAQEIECNFLGSGDAVIDAEISTNIKENLVKPPINKYLENNLWQWVEPIEGHRYLMGVDVSTGESEDSSSINIIDFDEMEQVVEYIGKIKPDDLAAIAYDWGMAYSCLIVVDITGGYGVATSRKLEEMNYKNLYVEGTTTNSIWEVPKDKKDKISGIKFNAKRSQIISAFEENLRKGFKIRSERLHNEITTFVYKNGRPDHMNGAHDDSIMAISMPMYVADISFSNMQRNDNLNKKLIESWVVSERTHEVKTNPIQMQQPSLGFGFDNVQFQTIYQNQQNNPKIYDEFSWLFKTRK